MAYQTILVDTQDRVRTITLNRPDRLNAWTAEMHTELKDAMMAAGDDEGVRAIILTGAGRGFCAGADMQGLQQIGASGTAQARTAKARAVPEGGSESAPAVE